LKDAFAACVKDATHQCFLMWCLTVFRRLLQHSCIYVVKWGVDTLIGDIGCDLIASKQAGLFYPFFFETLIHCLNTPQIFYEVEDGSESDQEIAEIKSLERFLVSATKSETRQEFFCKLFDVMGTFNWAPISLFIFTKSLSNIPSVPCLGARDYSMMKRLVTRILASQNVSIRFVSLQHLLVSLLNLIDCDNLELEALMNILTAFHQDGNLLRGSELWNHILAVVSRTSSGNEVVPWITKHAAQLDFPPVFAQMVTLLYDGGLIKNFCSLESVFSLLSDSNSRLYVDQDAQTKSVEVVAHMVKSSQSVDLYISQPCDPTREAILMVVKSTASDILNLLKKRLFSIDNRNAYQIATKLLYSFELLCKDKLAASILSKEKSCNSFISAAFDIVENDLQQRKINFVFAMKVVNVWCKSARDFNLSCFCSERFSKIVKKILDSSVLAQPPFSLASQLPPWTQEILGSASSATFEVKKKKSRNI